MQDTAKPPKPVAPKPDGQLPTYPSEALFRGGKVVLILHGGREYWLRITNANKLILTA